MNKPFRLGVIGATGTARKRVLPAIESSDIVRVVAAQARRREAVAELADLFEMEAAYVGVDELLNHPGLDGVYIATPPHLHAQQIEMALMHDLHVLVEKPLCIHAAEADHIAQLARKTDRVVAVAQHLRMHPALPWIRGLIGSCNTLGRPLAVSMTWTYRIDRRAKNAQWKRSPELNPGGVLADVGVHLIDFAQALFGDPDRAAVQRVRRMEGAPETVAARLEYAEHHVQLFCSWEAAKTMNALAVQGENGALFVENLFDDVEALSGVATLADGSRARVDFHAVELYGAQVEEFAVAARAGRPALATVEESRAALRLIDKILA